MDWPRGARAPTESSPAQLPPLAGPERHLHGRTAPQAASSANSDVLVADWRQELPGGDLPGSGKGRPS
jgi:hypothetical protein